MLPAGYSDFYRFVGFNGGLLVHILIMQQVLDRWPLSGDFGANSPDVRSMPRWRGRKMKHNPGLMCALLTLAESLPLAAHLCGAAPITSDYGVRQCNG